MNKVILFSICLLFFVGCGKSRTSNDSQNQIKKSKKMVQDFNFRFLLNKKRVRDSGPNIDDLGLNKVTIFFYPYRAGDPVTFEYGKEIGHVMAPCITSHLYDIYIFKMSCHLIESDDFYACADFDKNWNHPTGLEEGVPYGMCVESYGRTDAIYSGYPVNFLVEDGVFYKLPSNFANDFKRVEIKNPTIVIKTEEERKYTFTATYSTGKQEVFNLKSGYYDIWDGPVFGDL